MAAILSTGEKQGLNLIPSMVHFCRCGWGDQNLRFLSIAVLVFAIIRSSFKISRFRFLTYYRMLESNLRLFVKNEAFEGMMSTQGLLKLRTLDMGILSHKFVSLFHLVTALSFLWSISWNLSLFLQCLRFLIFSIIRSWFSSSLSESWSFASFKLEFCPGFDSLSKALP